MAIDEDPTPGGLWRERIGPKSETEFRKAEDRPGLRRCNQEAGVMKLEVLSRTVAVATIMLTITTGIIIVSVMLGTTAQDISELLFQGGKTEESQKAWAILLEYRVPRVLLAAAGGAGLALSGAVFQGVTRNPLADPYLMGIASGAALGAVTSLILSGEHHFLATSLAAFLGGLVSVGLVYGLVTVRRRGDYVNTIILAGVIVAALMNALMLLIISVSGSHEMQRILFWLMGDFSLADYQQVHIAGSFVVVGSVLIYAKANRLNLLMAGDDTAAHLGVHVVRTRTFFIIVGSLVTGAVVSVAGTVGFVGLVIPHVMRLLFGPDNRVLLPASFLGGAAFLAAADCVARLVAYPVELPVGVITALTGAPFFLYLLMRR
jgi:iron complex transport system permease protein